MGKAVTIGSGIFLSIGGFLFGYDSGIISSTIGQPTFVEYFGTPDAATTGGIVAGFSAGAVLGSLSAAWLGDILGRKKTIFVGGCISTLGCSLQTGAATVGMLIAGRILAGMAVGILTAAVPMYCSEIAEASYRGALSGLLQWMLCWGFLFAQWIGYGCNYTSSSFQWRFPLAVQVIPGLLLATGVWLLQESPRWLMEKGRQEEAHEALLKLHGNGNNQEYLDLEYREIRDTIIAEKAVAVRSWMGLISRPTWRRRLLLGCGIQIFGQISGVNVINYYGVTIYKLLGFSTRESLLIIGLSGSLSLVECSIALYFLERLGRIKLMIFSASGMACALLINAVLSQYFIHTDSVTNPNENALRAMVAMNFVFNPFFFTFTGVIAWVYNAEIFPVEIRARGNSLATVSNWCVGLIIGQISPTALDAVGFRYFYAFFVFNVVAAICYAVFYPDTKGRTLEQMDTLFGDQVVPHALEDPTGATAAMKGFEKDEMVIHAENT
ncbi:general substrate transporter [Lipomyces kononenkoae]|uniref:General substrate transporter n=1 Tax=Lipomyces kononenkoae TaxID=34357 RepID=A0ACC3STV0_LIPKO